MILVERMTKGNEVIGIYSSQKHLCKELGFPYGSIRNISWLDNEKVYDNYLLKNIKMGTLNSIINFDKFIDELPISKDDWFDIINNNNKLTHLREKQSPFFYQKILDIISEAISNIIEPDEIIKHSSRHISISENTTDVMYFLSKDNKLIYANYAKFLFMSLKNKDLKNLSIFVLSMPRDYSAVYVNLFNRKFKLPNEESCPSKKDIMESVLIANLK